MDRVQIPHLQINIREVFNYQGQDCSSAYRRGQAGMIHARNFRAGVPDAKKVAVCNQIGDAVKLAGKELKIDKAYTDFNQVMADSLCVCLDNLEPGEYRAETFPKSEEHTFTSSELARGYNFNFPEHYTSRVVYIYKNI